MFFMYTARLHNYTINYIVPDRLTAVSFQTHLHKINHHFAEAKQDFYVIGRDFLMITISQN